MTSSQACSAYELEPSGCTKLFNEDGEPWRLSDGRNSYRRRLLTGELEFYGGTVVTARKSAGGPAPRKQAAPAEGHSSIVGFGSLLSQASARSTFPALRNFRLGRIRGWRRVFAHPAAIFVKRGIARFESKELASLSVEPVNDDRAAVLVSCFEIPAASVATAFTAREEEFRFTEVQFEAADGSAAVTALACARATDEEVRERWGEQWFEENYVSVGLPTIWAWPGEILPCRVYLRHCVLAARKCGADVEASFLDGTFLWDRTTTVREHLKDHPSIMDEEPPASLLSRYSG